MGMTSMGKQATEMDFIMSKFNNSLAIQNIGSYAAVTGLVGTSSKSRNVNTGSFKTTASIGSTKGKNYRDRYKLWFRYLIEKFHLAKRSSKQPHDSNGRFFHN
jgi:hypothetical protein